MKNLSEVILLLEDAKPFTREGLEEIRKTTDLDTFIAALDAVNKSVCSKEKK